MNLRGLQRCSVTSIDRENARKSCRMPLISVRFSSTLLQKPNVDFVTPEEATKVMYKLTRVSRDNEDFNRRMSLSVESILASVESLNPELMSRAVWCMISLDVSPQVILSLPIQEAIWGMDSHSITRLTHKLHRIVPANDVAIWDAVLGSVISRLDKMTPVELVTCCCSFAKAGFKTPLLYNRITSRFVQDETSTENCWDISSWKPRQVSLLIWCLSTSECTNWNLMKFLIHRLPHLVLSSTDVACILSGLSRSNFILEDELFALIPIKQIFSSSVHSLQTLCTTLHSIARLGSLDDRLLLSHRSRGDVFPAGFWVTQDLVKFLTDEVLKHGPSLPLRALAMLTWSLAKLRIRYSPVFDLISRIHFPEKNSVESRADMVTIISSIAAVASNAHLAETAHSLLASTDWTAEETSTCIHLLWSISMMEGQSSRVSENELRMLDRLTATTTDRTDASMLFHYTLVRGIQGIEFPFGFASWKLTNMQWMHEQPYPSTIESTVSRWLESIPSIQSVKNNAEIFPGIYTDILVDESVAIEVNGPSHYSFDLISGEMGLDTKSVRRNELIAKRVKKVVNFSFADFSDMLALTESDRISTLVKLISF